MLGLGLRSGDQRQFSGFGELRGRATVTGAVEPHPEPADALTLAA